MECCGIANSSCSEAVEKTSNNILYSAGLIGTIRRRFVFFAIISNRRVSQSIADHAKLKASPCRRPASLHKANSTHHDKDEHASRSRLSSSRVTYFQFLSGWPAFPFNLSNGLNRIKSSRTAWLKMTLPFRTCWQTVASAGCRSVGSSPLAKAARQSVVAARLILSMRISEPK